MDRPKTTSYGFVTILSLVLLTSLFAVPIPTKAQAEAQWARYAGKGDEFSVLFPEPPAAYSKLRPELASEQRPPIGTDYERGRIYGAYADGIVYVIMSFDRGKEKLDDFVKEFQKYHRPESEMTFVRDVTQDYVNGKQYRIKLSNVEGVTHFYGTSKRFYVLQVVGDNESNPAIRRFLTSFILNGNAPIKDMAEGSGDVRASSTTSATSLSANESSTSAQVFSSKEVTRKAIVVMRPEPRFPQPDSIQGRIRIRAVLSSSGRVEDISVVEGRKGTTNEAIEAISNIKFIPAVKDGRFVSQYLQVEYQFHTYLR